MRGLSDFNAFTGRHSSVGERSLLGVTKDIGSQLKAWDVGALATFDMFYDGIENSVHASVKQNVISAGRNITGPDRDLALQVLKALLMTKYIDQFDATPQALAVLLTGKIDTNVAALHEDIERALGELERFTYVQRTGPSYHYLTNEEQDVEKAIKNHDLNAAAVTKLLNDEVVRASAVTAKVRHDATGVDLSLERWLDEDRQGRTEKLGIRFITPYSGFTVDDIKQQSIGLGGALFVVLELNDRTRDDIALYVRTQSYCQLQTKSAMPESRRRIIDSHERGNTERGRVVRDELGQAVAAAELVHNGTVIAIGGGPAKDRVHSALQVVIESLYNRINESRGVATMKEADLARLLRDENTFDLDVASTLDQLADTVTVQVRNAKVRQLNSTVGSLVDTFVEPPFGWSMTAVLAAVAHAVKIGRIELVLDTRKLVRSEIAAELRNTKKQRLIDVKEVQEHDPAKVRKLQSFYAEFSQESDRSSTADELIGRVRSLLVDEAAKLEGWISRPYPFTDLVNEARESIRAAVQGRSDDWYLDGFLSEVDGLLTLKDDLIDPIQTFLQNNKQYGIYDTARVFLDEQAAEIDAADAAEVAALREALATPEFFRDNRMRRIKQLHDQLAARVQAAVATDRAALRTLIEQRLETLLGDDVYREAPDAAQAAARNRIEVALTGLDGHTTRGQLALARKTFEGAYQAIIEDLLAARAAGESEPTHASSTPEPAENKSGTRAQTPVKKVPTTVRIVDIAVAGAPTMLSTPAHVDAYIEQLRTSLHTEVSNGKTVLL